MKKLIMAAVAAVSMATFGAPNLVTNSYDVYEFSMSTKIPYVTNGDRIYKTQKLVGQLYVGFNESNKYVKSFAKVTNKKTGVEHYLNMRIRVFNRIGKPSKIAGHSVPVIYIDGYDDTDNLNALGHEAIVEMNMAGSGSLKKLTTQGCTVCGGDTPSTVCTKFNKLTGYVNGVMDCLCPENEDWDHTVRSERCYELDSRSHYAPFWGTWTATLNVKQSDVTIIETMPY